MKNSSEAKQSQQIKDIIDKVLSVSAVEEISQVWDAAINSYAFPKDDISSFTEFNECLTEFVMHMPGYNREVSSGHARSEALTEAINLLERHYDNNGTRGYEAAYLDAIDTFDAGIAAVLTQLGEVMKQQQLFRLIEWHTTNLINPTDWPLQKQIVTHLIKLLGDSLPEVIRNSDPSRFTNTYRDLIALLQSAGQV
jgi:hypothetical protein